METIREFLSDQNKNTLYIEANVLSMYAKFQLHPPYGLSAEDFLIFFKNLPFMSPRQPVKLSDLGKMHLKRGGLLNKHMRQQKRSISTFPIISLWEL